MKNCSQHTYITRWVTLLVFAGLGAVLLGPGAKPRMAMAQEPAPPLNVIVIKTDDQRWDTLWAMPIVQQELVRRGVTFDNAFVSSAVCCPERASFLAGGFYAHNTGVIGNAAPNGGATKFVDANTLPVRLQRAGYRTAMLGKYLNEYNLIRPYIPPGWTRFVQTTGGSTWMTYGATVGSSGSEESESGEDIQVSQYLTDFLRDEALDFIRAVGSSPFFLYFTPYAPHTPAIPAPGDEALFANYLYRGRGYQEEDLSDKPYLRDDAVRYDTAAQDEFNRRQLRSLQAVDRAVGAIVQELKTLGKLDQTLLVFMSDNGYLWGEHWQIKKALPYEESIRVPLVVVMPGILPRQDRRLVVANLDVPTTILEVAGIPRLDTDGRSLVPLLRDPAIPWRTEFLIEHYAVSIRTTSNPSTPGQNVWAGLRTSRYKYVDWGSGHRLLFDLVRDTYELQNEIDNPVYQPLVQALAGQLEALKGLAVISLNPPPGKVGQSFTWPWEAWGGTPPYVWAVVEGSLPPGLTLDSVTGLLAGTPTQAGAFPVSIQASDASVSPYSGQPQAHVRLFTCVINP